MKQPATYVELLTGMLAIPAHSGEEHERAGFLQRYLVQSGLDVKRIHNNLLVGLPQRPPSRRRKADLRPRILMNSHMDTVAPVKGWKGDPYRPRFESGRITGLGSNDAGASVVTMIATYQDLSLRLKDQMELLLLISAEEEVSGANGITAVLPLLEDIDGAIVGEPTGMQPAVAERGLMVLDGIVRGKAGHAARDEGENAIYGAMEDIRAIAGLHFDKRSKWLPDPGAQVTMISAGTNHNVVPDLCRYVVDVRSNDRYPNRAMLEMIRSVCRAELTPRSTRLNPSAMDPDHFLMEAVRKSGLRPYGSSTLSDMALIPCPCIKMGPGDPARSHTAGEYILLSELEAGIRGYTALLEILAEMFHNAEKTGRAHG
ncbi:MAG TPA: M20/M25/M40 family metallo-hydrolase [Bacteroides sp.]|nr:M20/M25/M40 family metallo-hydrolase [Bacteroides sp.]